MTKIQLIYALSFSWSCGTLLIFSYMPYYATEVLKINHTNLGLIEGMAIFSAFLSKIFAGMACDYFKNRSVLIKVGTYLTFFSRVGLYFASNGIGLFAARTVDRLSKGIRSTPTDAMTADLALLDNKIHYMAHRQSFYTLGGIAGAVLTMLSPMHFSKFPFILAILMGVVSIVLSSSLKDNEQITQSWPKWSLKECQHIKIEYWIFLIFIFILMISRFSEAFLLLRSKKLNLSAQYYPSIIISMDLTHSIFAYYFKSISKKYQYKTILISALVIVSISHIGLYFTHSLISFFFFTLLIGIHMGLAQPILKILVAQLSPKNLLGTSYALFNFVSGIGVLLGNFLIGTISDKFGIQYCFLAGFFSVILSLLFLIKFNTFLLKKKIGP